MARDRVASDHSPELSRPPRQVHFVHSSLTWLATTEGLKSLAEGLTGREIAEYRRMGALSIGQGRSAMEVSTGLRIGESYSTYSLTCARASDSTKLFARAYRVEHADGGEQFVDVPIGDEGALLWVRKRDQWCLISQGSRLAEQTELPIVIAHAQDPDRALNWVLHTANKLTTYEADSTREA